ncbi:MULTISPECIES: dermonecrotic toxin domain-containing protein [Pseudomonas fluorescens group]|uniref:Dermonecrotic toxin N-terminal domain-containing protein n=1 Tax=Pseudomonas fluorescens TaxID=294 RepID=A0A0D0RFJ4_PSEFL|nr:MULTISPECIES: DUF6543 domain-containing protein [Pseudomonas fluorescens group]AZE61502.1 hypothetical protein C4K02_3142 [Pseudomonas synxantha]KIR18157.1 hypothetical protein PFLU3_51520 [Pseudomonas fluorescens]
MSIAPIDLPSLQIPSLPPADASAGNAQPGVTRQRPGWLNWLNEQIDAVPYKRPAFLDTLSEASQDKAVLTPEGASRAYFDAPVKRNEALDDYARNYTPIKTPNEVTSEQVKAHIEATFGFIDVDPDKTFLMTIVFNHKSDKEHNKGVINQKISLTDAARLNIQGIELPYFSGPSSRSEYREGPPLITIDPKSRHTGPPSPDGQYSVPNNFTYNKWTHGIYLEPYPGAPDIYDHSNHHPIPPEEFKQMVWDNAYKKPYDNYLKDYWNANTRAQFTATSTIAYLTAAHIQHHEKSLTENDRKIAMGVAGLHPDKTYLSATPDDFKQPYKADPNLESKFLMFNGFESRMFYTRDKTTGRILLYVPGLLPPLQGFDSVEPMNRWLGEQLRDPEKREPFKLLFRPQDRPSSGPMFGPFGGWSLGVDKKIDQIADDLDHYVSQETQESYGYWKEGGLFDGKVFKGNPFEELQLRTEQAAKAATDQLFVLNSDHEKNTAMKWLKIASYGLIALAPLGMAFPPFGVALTAAATSLGAAELGIGIDDHINNRPSAPERIVSGVVSTLKPLMSEGFGKAFAPITKSFANAVFKA